MTAKTIFGREPAAVAATLEAALSVLGSLVFRWTDSQVGLVVAVVAALFGIYTAWATVDTLLGYIVGGIKAILALAIGFGLHPDPRTASALISFAVIGIGLFQRSATSPSGYPIPSSPSASATVPVLDPNVVAAAVTPVVVTPAADPAPVPAPDVPAGDPEPTDVLSSGPTDLNDPAAAPADPESPVIPAVPAAAAKAQEPGVQGL